MLRCKDIVANATDYVDEQLSWRQSMAMALHLLMCGHCRRFIKYFRLSLKAIRSKQTISADQADQLSKEIIARALVENK